MTLPTITVVNPASFEEYTDEGERFAGLVKGFVVKEIDTRGGTGKVLHERRGLVRPTPWDWYVDKKGRGKVYF